MKATVFITFLLGILAEMIFLWEGANPHWQKMQQKDPNQELTPPWELTAPRILLGIFTLLAAGGVLVLDLLGWAESKVFIDSSFVGAVMIVLGVFVLFSALWSQFFVPVVNEQNILVVQGLVLYGVWGGGHAVAWLPRWALLVLPVGVMVGLLLWRRALPPLVKALVYLWYLVSLMVLPFQSGQVAYFTATDLSLLDGVVFGSLFFFLIIHGLFAVRFFLIASSMLVPRNRDQVAQLMPQLFTDEQASPGRFALVVAVLALVLGLNRWLALLPEAVLLSLGLMFGVQFLSRVGTKGGK